MSKGVNIATVAYGNLVNQFELSKTVTGSWHDNLLVYEKASEVMLASTSLLGGACEQNANYPDGIQSRIDYNQLKKAQNKDDALVNVTSISILATGSNNLNRFFLFEIFNE